LEESTCKVILMVGPSLETWGLKPFGAILRYQTELVFGQNFPTPLEVILHIDTFPMVQKSRQSEVV
jgi:hypothetical protein